MICYFVNDSKWISFSLFKIFVLMLCYTGWPNDAIPEGAACRQ